MNREATAYHEAGHAVAAWRRRIAIKAVTIRPERGQYHGAVLFRSSRFPGLDPSEQWAERRIVAALAGPLAQRRFAPRTVRGWHSEADYQFAAELALRTQGSGKLATAWLAWLQISTEALVEANWRHIESVAGALLAGETLSGSEVVETIQSAARAARL